jgi:hypothetical protein
VAAALHLTQVALAARKDPRFQIHIAAQQPAAKHFMDAGLAVEIVPPCAATSIEGARINGLDTMAADLLTRVQPDVVLCGLSTPFDAGLDEAVLARTRTPSVLFQDFWGEQNLLLGKGADLVLAVDDEAVQLNFRRYGIQSTKVGSARHAAYKSLELEGTKAHNKAMLGLQRQDTLIGFFGQALHHLPGYMRTVKRFVSVLTTLNEPVHLLVRPHPRENTEQRQSTAALFQNSGLHTVLSMEGTVEDALAACDVSCSLFSTCTYDAAYLNRFSATPLTVPLSMLFDPEILAYCEQHVNFDTFPYHRTGTVAAVHSERLLGPTIEDALSPTTRERIWHNAHVHLEDPAMAPWHTLNAIARYVDDQRGR